MDALANTAQLVIALSIPIVWVGRFDNIVREFRQFGLPDIVRTMVGATKIVLATLLVTGIWYPALVTVPALMMAALMLGAQVAHFSVRNPWHKDPPSLALLMLSLLVAGVRSGTIG